MLPNAESFADEKLKPYAPFIDDSIITIDVRFVRHMLIEAFERGRIVERIEDEMRGAFRGLHEGKLQ